MANELVNLLIELGTDPEKLSRFNADPDAEIKKAGLSREQSAALLSREPRRIREVLSNGALAGSGSGHIWVCAAQPYVEPPEPQGPQPPKPEPPKPPPPKPQPPKPGPPKPQPQKKKSGTPSAHKRLAPTSRA